MIVGPHGEYDITVRTVCKHDRARFHGILSADAFDYLTVRLYTGDDNHHDVGKYQRNTGPNSHYVRIS